MKKVRIIIEHTKLDHKKNDWQDQPHFNRGKDAAQS